eukprot:14562652-Alexandrium_andersonii.AAC.1
MSLQGIPRSVRPVCRSPLVSLLCWRSAPQKVLQSTAGAVGRPRRQDERSRWGAQGSRAEGRAEPVGRA